MLRDKIKKKINQEKDKNIAIKRIMIKKNELKNKCKNCKKIIIKKSIKHRNRAIKSIGTKLKRRSN
jgi:acetyl-CoA carboxylase beta subunit